MSLPAAASASAKAGLQPIEPQTARVALIADERSVPVGAACLISNTHLITCRHVVEAASGERRAETGKSIRAQLIGVTGQPTVQVTVAALASTKAEYSHSEDIALLSLRPEDSDLLAIKPVEFSTPLVHSGKSFAVMGFPANHPFGLHAAGQLHAADATGLVQMVGSESIGVAPGFSGSPVWSPELKSFVGIVVAGEDGRGLAWCIPSRILCGFYPELLVRFRIPVPDRPTINDYDEDDPNPILFGDVSDNGHRRLTATVRRGSPFNVSVKYECLPESAPPRGGFVTFITYPDFESDHEDAYELFARLDSHGVAKQSFSPAEGFTVAAIGDAGDTALTLDLCRLKQLPAGFH